MDDDVRSMVEALHATPALAVLAVTGAGSRALAWLLGVGGASRTVLEATVPYAAAALRDYAGGDPAEYASAEAASMLASAARRRARVLAGTGAGPLLGLGCAATIATDRTKRGEHRAYVAIAAADGDLEVRGLRLEKGARDRDEEEEVVSRLVLASLAGAAGVDGRLDLRLRPSERVAMHPVAGERL